MWPWQKKGQREKAADRSPRRETRWKLARLREETKTTCVWLLEERAQGMCSIRGNRMHSLNQLPANPVAQSHILIFITARVGIHTSTSHDVFPSIPFRSVSATSCFIHSFPRPKFVNPQLHHDGLCKHKHFVNLLCFLLLSGTQSSYSPPFTIMALTGKSLGDLYVLTLKDLHGSCNGGENSATLELIKISPSSG